MSRILVEAFRHNLLNQANEDVALSSELGSGKKMARIDLKIFLNFETFPNGKVKIYFNSKH